MLLSVYVHAILLLYCIPPFLCSPVICPLTFVFQTLWVKAGLCYAHVQYLLLWIEVILYCHVVNNWFSGPCSDKWLWTAWSYLGCCYSDMAFLCFSHFHLHCCPSKLLSITEIEQVISLSSSEYTDTSWHLLILKARMSIKIGNTAASSRLTFNIILTGSVALGMWWMSFYDCVQLLYNGIWWLCCQ